MNSSEASPSSTFDAGGYWEARLSEEWSLRNVGVRTFGRKYNEWAYKLRGERFHSMVSRYVPAGPNARVVDIGSGTGFYLAAWRDLGMRDVTGVDLAPTAVANLKRQFPEVRVLDADITEGVSDLQPESFDAVSAIDVLFHIVDHRRLADALKNISALLVPGGHFVWTDFFTRRRESVANHIAFRSLYRVEALLDAADLDVVAREPFLFTMNEPRDASRWVLQVWKAFMWSATLHEALADSIGRILYKLDRALCSMTNEGPTTEIMVCRRRGRTSD